MPTRELVGVLNDVRVFASPDDEDSTWHRVTLRWDGARLHAMAGSAVRMAWMSWGPDDGDQPVIPDLEYSGPGDPWELAINPDDAKEIATKFKVGTKEGDTPVRVTGTADSLRVERDSDTGAGVALTSVALARPWDDTAPRIDEVITGFAAQAEGGYTKSAVGYTGAMLADFCNPKVVRQRGPVELHLGRSITYIKIGKWFRGAVIQAHSDDFTARP
jgi:hypothetical protein